MLADSNSSSSKYISRGGNKLASALDDFKFSVEGLTCADLGSNVGGFVDCLLQRGASMVYSIDTSYGTLGWRLRKDPRVVVMERTNAMHFALPEPVDLVTIDVGWTRQGKVLPNVRRVVKSSGSVISLVKPHYEATPESLIAGVLPDDACGHLLTMVLAEAQACLFDVAAITASPLRGHGGNQEFFAYLLPSLATCVRKAEPLETQIARAIRSQYAGKMDPNDADEFHDN